MQKQTILIGIVVLSSIMIYCSSRGDFPVLREVYLGQGLPGDEPELFAPGIVSTGMYERDVAMTPDGKEMYFGLIFGQVVTIFGSRLENGRWTEPEIVPSFTKYPGTSFFEPHITPDGSRMLFLCTHPPDGKEPRPGWFYQNIWAVDRLEDGGWGDIYDIGAPVNTDDNEYFPSATKDRTLYFTRSKRGSRQTQVLRARMVDGKYAEPEALPASVIGAWNIYNAFIHPDEKYLIACVAGREDCITPGLPDYYVFFRDENDRWSDGINLGEKINFPGSRATSAYVSPDGRFLFFASDKLDIPESGRFTYDLIKKLYDSPENGSSDIYWMDASFIESLRPSGL